MAAWHIASGEEMLLRCRGRQSLERGLKYAQTAAPAVATIETGIQYDCMTVCAVATVCNVLWR